MFASTRASQRRIMADVLVVQAMPISFGSSGVG